MLPFLLEVIMIIIAASINNAEKAIFSTLQKLRHLFI
jgi:hypothetical protein